MFSYSPDDEPSCAWVRHAYRVWGEDRFVFAFAVLSDDAQAGWCYAREICVRDNERREAFADDLLPPRITTRDIAREERVTVKTVRRRIARARYELFGNISDRSIRRRPSRLERSNEVECADCGRGFVRDASPQRARGRGGRLRVYCPDCSTPAAYTRRSRARKG